LESSPAGDIIILCSNRRNFIHIRTPRGNYHIGDSPTWKLVDILEITLAGNVIVIFQQQGIIPPERIVGSQYPPVLFAAYITISRVLGQKIFGNTASFQSTPQVVWTNVASSARKDNGSFPDDKTF
jgi:hypothetical protein